MALMGGAWRSRLRSPWLLLGGLALGFLAIITFQLRPPDPESRLPSSQRLPALISRQQDEIAAQRVSVEKLRSQLQDERNSSASQEAGLAEQSDEVVAASRVAGIVAVRGQGFTVSLADLQLVHVTIGQCERSCNSLTRCSSNRERMWAAGAEAIAINGERLVGSSAILCVGNTLLLNGTVHAPPYDITAIGANRDEVFADPLVKRLSQAAQDFSLKFSTSRASTVTLPAYSGAISLRYAAVAPTNTN